MPIIFAQALMFVPGLLTKSDNSIINSIGIEFTNMFGLWYNVLFGVLIIIFSYFYTANVSFKTDDVADNLKKQNGFVPGIRPGAKTAEYLEYVVSRLLVLGAAYLALVCLLPEILRGQFSIPFYFGGTSVLIVVSVTMDTIQQVQSHLLAHQYEGLIQKSQLRGKGKKRGSKGVTRK